MLDKNIISEMILIGFILDGRSGGLVLGRSHEEGNIYTITERDGKYECSACMEGGEYLINKRSSAENKSAIIKINTFNEPHAFPPIELNNFVRIFNTSAEPNDKIILIEYGQFIINKNATAKHLPEIEKINNKNNPYLYCHIEKILPHAFNKIQ